MSVGAKPNREGEAPAEPDRDVKTRSPRMMTAQGAVFVPSGTPDNSPPFQRWDINDDDKASPGRDERVSQRNTTTMMHQRNATKAAHQRDATTIMAGTINTKCLSPLWGFGIGWPCKPTDESVGYCRESLRDKDTIVGDLREIVALIEQEEGVEP